MAWRLEVLQDGLERRLGVPAAAARRAQGPVGVRWAHIAGRDRRQAGST